jgi:death-on-curing protein
MSAPAAEPMYLSLDDVVAIHRAAVLRMGRSPEPLRDPGLLESAITRARTAAHYEGADLVRQATLLAVSISQAQAFVDGNKRAGLASADIFLRLNGLAFTGDSLEFARQFGIVAGRASSLEDATDVFEAWLRERVGPRTEGRS